MDKVDYDDLVEICKAKNIKIERLRKIARNAYTEGWKDRADDTYSMQSAWQLSKTFQALKGE